MAQLDTMRKSRRTRTRVLTIAVGLILGASLSGCTALLQLATQPQRNETISPAEMHNSVLAREAETLLDHVWDGEWDLPLGGNVRVQCDGGQGQNGDAFLFYGSWFSPAQAEMPGDSLAAQAAVADLRGWLEARGWTDLEEFEFTTDVVDVNAWGIGGANAAQGIYEMQTIFYYEGDFGVDFPHVVIDIDSDCLASDAVI